MVDVLNSFQVNFCNKSWGTIGSFTYWFLWPIYHNNFKATFFFWRFFSKFSVYFFLGRHIGYTFVFVKKRYLFKRKILIYLFWVKTLTSYLIIIVFTRHLDTMNFHAQPRLSELPLLLIISSYNRGCTVLTLYYVN